MSQRFHAAAAAALAVALSIQAAPAVAQQVVPPPGSSGDAIESMQAPKDLPRAQRGDPVRNLDFLFGALKAAPDADTAKQVENRIWALWLASGSDTANLLMMRVKTAIEAKDLDLAIKLLDSVVQIKPDYVEAWNRRATLHYMRKDFGKSMEDIRQVLLLEPRHFGAMSGLGMILQEFGDERRALAAFRKALEIYPHLPKIPEAVKALTEKVDGRDI
ncbi:MAG: tetratricopeptide repeat protein [Alphaproteobacteria bacterium]|nr:tetratricopeptide repeat protein [Alphaproteobacteria bacterium]